MIVETEKEVISLVLSLVYICDHAELIVKINLGYIVCNFGCLKFPRTKWTKMQETIYHSW